MLDVYIGLGVFVIVYLSYLFIIILNKRRLDKYIKKSQETCMIKSRYKLNYDKINHKLVANLFGITNGFILGIAYVIFALVKGIIFKILVTMSFLIVVVSVLYLAIGKYLKKQEV